MSGLTIRYASNRMNTGHSDSVKRGYMRGNTMEKDTFEPVDIEIMEFDCPDVIVGSWGEEGGDGPAPGKRSVPGGSFDIRRI